LWFEANPSEPYPKSYQNQIKSVSKSYQKRIKIISKPYQSHTKTTKTREKSTKNLPLGCFGFFLKPTHWNHIKKTYQRYQNQIKIVSKAYHNQTISKSNQNNKNPRKIDQKPVPGLFLFLFLKPTHWNHIKTVSKSHQNRIKIVSKHQNHSKIISKPPKPSRNRPKGCPGAVSVSFLEANPSGTLQKALRSQTISNHIKITSKTISKT